MLAKVNRLTRAQDFRQAMREGMHAHSEHLILHQYVEDSSNAVLPARVGFVVAKRFVKHATGRNLIKRRLRHLVRGRLGEFPPGSLNVFYAKSGIDKTDYAQLDDQVNAVLAKMNRKQANRGNFRGAPQSGVAVSR